MPRFARADKVRLKGSPEREGIVTDVYDDGPEAQYEVFFSAGETTTYAESSLLSLDDLGAASGPIDLLKQWRLGSAEEFRSFLTLAKLSTPIANNLYSFLASRTELLPYQFKPVLKLIESPYSRMLVADEVGLGKTIEAGIILTELNARAPLRQILVVCPAALLGKWRTELRDRFEWDFDILDGPAFREQIGELAVRGDRVIRGIASLELLRREENMAALTSSAPRFDAVIVDEAHHMRNQGTMSNFLGETLSGFTDTLLFLTATPLNLGERDFFELLHLLVPEEFTDFEVFRELIEPNESINAALRTLRHRWPPDFAAAASALREIEAGSQAGRFQRNSRFREALNRLDRAAQGTDDDRASAVETQRIIASLNTLGHAFTRTKKREVSEHFPTRRAHRVSVGFTQQEMAFYEAVTRWAIHIGYEADIPLGFIVTAFQRQAASCIPAMGAKLEESERLSEVRFFDEELIDLDPTLLDDSAISHMPAPVSPNGDGEDSGLGVSTVDLTGSRSRLLEDLAKAWREVGGIDTKYQEFEEALRRLFEEGEDRVLVFAFFIRTIDYLEERLGSFEIDGAPVTVHKMYGLTPADDRHSVINRFRTGEGPQILLSSEVGSEGLDFQFCSAMVNYDLPWNPMRVEQRIGRLDRYGQESELIQIFNLVVTDTIEDRIFYRLYERIGIFERSIGDLEAILGDPMVGSSLAGLQRDVLMRSLTPEEQEQRTNHIANAILNLQKEHEEFDEQSRKFLGIDDVFTERFNDIRESERYITAAELRNFVEQFLARRFPKLTLRPIDGGGNGQAKDVFELVNSEDRDFIDFLTDAYHRDPNASRLHDKLILHLSFGERCALTFDSHRAMIDRTLEFFSIHHPIVRAAVMEESEREDLLPTGKLSLSNSVTHARPRLFFIFELESRGLKDEVELMAAVVTPDGSIDEQLSTDLLAVLGDAESPSGVEETDLLADEKVDGAHAAARTWAGEQVARRKAELEQVVNEAVDARLESLRLGHERTIARVKTQLREANQRGQERIARMRQGQLVNVRRQYEAKTRELEAKRGADVGHRIVAAGLVC